MTVGMTTFIFTILSMTVHEPECSYAECHLCKTSFMLNGTNMPFKLSIIMLNVLYAECPYAECPYAECPYAECPYAKCRYAECCYAECSGTLCQAFLVCCNVKL
jgi:hypothetical protein